MRIPSKSSSGAIVIESEPKARMVGSSLGGGRKKQSAEQQQPQILFGVLDARSGEARGGRSG